MSESIFNVINKLYDKGGFLDKYGGSLWGTIIVCIVFFLAISYYYIYNHIQPIKSDWINQRCKPYVIPFAGLINPPINMSGFEFTSQNFSGCIQNILADIVGIFLAPFYYLVNLVNKTLSVISESIQAIREILNVIRKALASISSEIMNRSLNIMIPLQHVIINLKDMMGKTSGILTASIYTLLGIYDTLQATIGSIVEIVVTILLGLAALIAIFFMIPFGFGLPFAIPLLVIFILITIPAIMVYIIQVMILKNMARSLPGAP